MVYGLQLFRAYLFSLADLQMNKVRAVLLPAGCTSKEAEGGSGLWVMVSIWPWPPGLGRWCYVASAPRHLLVAPPFRPCLDKWKRAITLEEVSFHFNAKKEREKKALLTKWLTLDFKVSSKSVAGRDRSQRVKLASVSAVAGVKRGKDNKHHNRWLIWIIFT